MESLNIAPFYLGQRVIAVTARHRLIAKGAEYMITGVFRDCCSWTVTVGLPMPANRCMQCGKCGLSYSSPNREMQIIASTFKPIHHDYQAITYKEVIKEQAPAFCVN